MNDQLRERYLELADAYERIGTVAEVSRKLSASKRTVRKALKYAAEIHHTPPPIPAKTPQVTPQVTPQDFTVHRPPSADEPLELLWQRKAEQFERSLAAEKGADRIQVDIHQTGPIGILHFGDPHLDSDACDVIALRRDIQLVQQTPALYAGLLGDMTDNWIGRLMAEYANSKSTARDGFRLARDMITQLGPRIVYAIAGNHDLWHGQHRDPVQWFMEQTAGPYQTWRSSLRFVFPNGREVDMLAHHDFPGNSMWNPGHSTMRAAQTGARANIVIQGHRHLSFDAPVVQGDGTITHCISVGAYKRLKGEYETVKGFRPHYMSPSVVTVIDPDSPDELGLVTRFVDSRAGAMYLTALRKSRGLK